MPLPSEVTADKVQVRVDVKDIFIGDNRDSAHKEIAFLGETLIFNEDGSVTKGSSL